MGTMARCQTLTLLALAGASIGGCAPEPTSGTPVVLNERLFQLPSMQSAGKGCTTFHLKKRSSDVVPTSGAGSGNIAGLIVSQRSGGEFVLIQVTEGGRVVAERRYGEDFFRGEKLDEFTVRGSGGEEELLRYWGAIAVDGTVRCAPFEDDGDSAR